MQVNNKNNISFGIKVPTRNVILAVTPLNFQCCTYYSFKEPFNVMKQMTGQKDVKFTRTLALNALCAKNLKQQFPILEEIAKEAEKFFKTMKENFEDINKWVEKQIQKIGKNELDVIPVELNNNDIENAVDQLYMH